MWIISSKVCYKGEERWRDHQFGDQIDWKPEYTHTCTHKYSETANGNTDAFDRRLLFGGKSYLETWLVRWTHQTCGMEKESILFKLIQLKFSL